MDPGTQILVAVPKFISYGKRPQSLFKGLRGKDSRRWGILEMAQDFQYSYRLQQHTYLSLENVKNVLRQTYLCKIIWK